MNSMAILLALIVGVWNSNWFPSGRAEHRAEPEVEAKTIAVAAEMLKKGLEELDPTHTEDVILCLNEMRGPRVVSNLVAAIGWPRLESAVVTGYRRRDRFDQQQDAIATTLPVEAAHWSVYKHRRDCWPPRGYAFLAVSNLHVYCTHLKSEYGATSEELREANREKRAYSIEQLITCEKPPRKKDAPPPPAVIIAGDMNADFSKAQFKKEKFFKRLDAAGFSNPLAALPAERRDTHPSKRWGANTLDYIFLRGLGEPTRVFTAPLSEASDHCALFYRIDFPAKEKEDETKSLGGDQS